MAGEMCADSRKGASRSRGPRPRLGLTLLELVVVLAILAAVAGILVPMVANIVSGPSIKLSPGGEGKSAQQVVTEATLGRIREAIMGSGGDPGYYGDLGALPWPPDGSRQDYPQMRYLFVNPRTEDATNDFDPDTCRGWRGPYLLGSTGCFQVDLTRGFGQAYGETGDPALIDAWGLPIVIALRNEDGRTNAYLVSAGKDAILGTADDVELALCEDLNL